MINIFYNRKLLLAALLVIPHTALFAYQLNMGASVVIGQPNFSSWKPNQGVSAVWDSTWEAPHANTLMWPEQSWIADGRLFIADGRNERVLVYNTIPVVNNAPAEIVIGQVDFTQKINGYYFTSARSLARPSGVMNAGEKLIVLDRDSHRVLIYNDFPIISNDSADVVIGQDSMTTSYWFGDAGVNDSFGVSDTTLSSGPTGITYDAPSGKLIVSDTDNNRILIYNQLPTTNGVAADVVIGQADFTHNLDNRGGAPAANTLDLSTGPNVSTYNGKLFVADRLNHRVLIFNQIPTSNNASADIVIGQPDFFSNSPNQGGPIGPNTLFHPRCAVVDNDGKLLVVDGLNARILVYNSIPTENNVAADLVIGQPDFETGIPSSAGQLLNNTFDEFLAHIAFTDDQFVVTDNGNSRVLIFDNSLDVTAPALVGLPTIGEVTSSTIEITKPITVTETESGLFQWQIRKNGSTTLKRRYVATTMVIDSLLLENSHYSYDVRFVDKSGNVGDFSGQVEAVTLANPPTNFTLRLDNQGVNILRVDSLLNDNVGLAGYYFENITANTNSGWINRNSWQDTPDLGDGNVYTYNVKYRNSEGIETTSISLTTTPREFFLSQNYPNPFNSVTRFRYGLASGSEVKLKIFDQMGRQVVTIVNAIQPMGDYQVQWDGMSSSGWKAPPGTYFMRMETGQFVQTTKMLFVK